MEAIGPCNWGWISYEMAAAPYTAIAARVAAAADAAGHPVRLVAVSKTKPADAVREMYRECGHRVFGENYVQELHEKATELRADCPDIEWHFIGHLQSNKTKLLCSTPNLTTIQSVHSVELARKIDAAARDLGRSFDIMLQVNSSGEGQKGGLAPGDVVDANRAVRELQHVRLVGLMTIGMVDNAEHDFAVMRGLADDVRKQLGVERVELSMGMSADFEQAIAFGSTVVRVGTALFGARSYPKH